MTRSKLMAVVLVCFANVACGESDDEKSCEAAPACDAGTDEVTSCIGRDACEPVTVCGTTIFCADPNEPCNATPSCNADETEVGSCAGESDCRTVTVCDATIYCDGPDTCDETPQCAGSENQVPSCTGQSSCREVTACGTTIYCAATTTCDGVCDEGYDDVAGCATAPLCVTESCDGMTAYCFPFDSATCDENADCPEFHYCEYPDGLCGTGQPGKCKPEGSACPFEDTPPVCYCGGTVYDGDGSAGNRACRGRGGLDYDATTSCEVAATAIKCGHLICDLGDDDFCQRVIETNGSFNHPDASCGQFAGCGGGPIDCDCIAANPAVGDCGSFIASCQDTPNGPIVTCTEPT